MEDWEGHLRLPLYIACEMNASVDVHLCLLATNSILRGFQRGGGFPYPYMGEGAGVGGLPVHIACKENERVCRSHFLITSSISRSNTSRNMLSSYNRFPQMHNTMSICLRNKTNKILWWSKIGSEIRDEVDELVKIYWHIDLYFHLKLISDKSINSIRESHIAGNNWLLRFTDNYDSPIITIHNPKHHRIERDTIHESMHCKEFSKAKIPQSN